ncbi:MAG: cytochrome C oxidase subunit IV family protein [Herpetosiphonaceae bacterium]|nr:cytochrome C oxidase subunit IV family protein [Herpetosiphonaceae bacterium]
MAKEYGVSRGDEVHEMQHTHQHPPYMTIFYLLTALTIIEVSSTGVINRYVGLSPEIALPRSIGVPFLLVVSAIKAVMVAMFYMHLKYDKRLYSVVIGGPLIFAAIFIVLTIHWG